jgi:hypothetical protein
MSNERARGADMDERRSEATAAVKVHATSIRRHTFPPLLVQQTPPLCVCVSGRPAQGKDCADAKCLAFCDPFRLFDLIEKRWRCLTSIFFFLSLPSLPFRVTKMNE